MASPPLSHPYVLPGFAASPCPPSSHPCLKTHLRPPLLRCYASATRRFSCLLSSLFSLPPLTPITWARWPPSTSVLPPPLSPPAFLSGPPHLPPSAPRDGARSFTHATRCLPHLFRAALVTASPPPHQRTPQCVCACVWRWKYVRGRVCGESDLLRISRREYLVWASRWPVCHLL